MREDITTPYVYKVMLNFPSSVNNSEGKLHPRTGYEDPKNL